MHQAIGLVDRVRAVLAAAGPPVREVTMFGGLSFMVNEKMVAFLQGDGDLLVRSDPARADELLSVKEARSAEMGAGRAMSKGWISVSDEAIANDQEFAFCRCSPRLQHPRSRRAWPRP